MGFPVRYTCPRCDAVVTLDREGYLADKCVTEAPLTGWEYVPAYEPFEDADGVELVCGASETDGEGCGRPFYLSFVRFEEGREVEGDAPLRPEDAPRFDFRP
jgi:hypothetical protein